MSWEQLNLDLITVYGSLIGLWVVVAVLRLTCIRHCGEPGSECP